MVVVVAVTDDGDYDGNDNSDVDQGNNDSDDS